MSIRKIVRKDDPGDPDNYYIDEPEDFDFSFVIIRYDGDGLRGVYISHQPDMTKKSRKAALREAFYALPNRKGAKLADQEVAMILDGHVKIVGF